MAFTAAQEATLKTLADSFTFDELRLAIDVAKDELIRIVVNSHLNADAKDDSLANRTKAAQARAIFRKMYRHHADGRQYPWSIDQIKAGLTRRALIDHFEPLPDPRPDSNQWRTAGT